MKQIKKKETNNKYLENINVILFIIMLTLFWKPLGMIMCVIFIIADL
jgi:hypothetical protein